MPNVMPGRRLCLALSAGLALAGCETPQDPVITTADGSQQIQIRAGLNCYDNQCFHYEPASGTIHVSSRRNIRPPAGVPLASGQITPGEFRATYN
ncbi:MAG: hypothetical protein ACWA5A_13080, partial [Marinibacterium sp.]